MGDSKKLVSELKSSSSIVEWKFQWFCRAFAVMGMLLFWSTWKLWTPQTAYPQIPFFEFLVDVPGFVDWTALTFVVCSLIVILLAMSDRIRSIGFIGFALAAIALILLNQHRLQPWAYQFVIFAIILGVARPQIAFFWMRWIVISIYIYSAISKMDYQFVHTVGEELLCDLGYKFGIDFGPWSPDFKENWILIMPRIELFIGAGLAFQRSRRYAAIGAIALHAILVLALIGNVDGWGVLLWNLFFIDMIFLLFYSSLQAESESVVTEPRGPVSNGVLGFCDSRYLSWYFR